MRCVGTLITWPYTSGGRSRRGSPKAGTDHSDHFIFSSHKFRVKFTLLVNAMFMHGYTADNLLLNVLKPIPKDVRGNLSDSNNYRGISLCSSLSKAVDNIIIKRYGNLLNTNELQFGFKPNHSTNVCTGIMKHVISYYNNNNTNVYACKLDASKAFDRVQYGTLFEILQKRRMPVIVIRLLLDMYTRQSTCILWNGSRSTVFDTKNGVRQGGVLSPILFCVYMDELFTRIRKSGYGCHVGHISYAVFGYADDVKLLSPTIRGLQKLLEICETFAQEYNVTFNAEKTQCIRYGKYAYTRDTHSGVMLEGKLLNWHSSITYLGSVLRYDLSDDADIRQKVGICVSQVNNLNKRFGQLSMRVKSKLMQSYCCSWFGCQTWDINCKYAKKMNISWNKAVRRVLGIPYRTHTALLPYLIENPSFRKQHTSRYIKFYNSLLMSDNDSVKYIAECAYVNVTSVLGINRVHCQSTYGTISRPAVANTNYRPLLRKPGSIHESLECENRAAQITQLIGVKEGTVLLPGFDDEEVDGLLDMLCCD